MFVLCFTVFIHIHVQALLKSTRPTLVAVSLINGARPASAPVLTDVRPIPPYAPLEESTAAVTRVDPVVFARAPVAAHLTRDVQNSTFVRD